MKSRQIEVMAPVGSKEALLAAINAHADSIYFGVGHLNMRSHSAANFDGQDMLDIVHRCHDANIKCYLTLNTIIYPDDMEAMRRLVDEALRCEVDAIIASDIAVLEYARLKGMPTHISTQANICNIEAIKHYSYYADVMVLARELNLSQVKIIADRIATDNITDDAGKPIRLEMFCHGALCMAISGKCYLSLDNANKSANRGECLQLCRRAYSVCDMETGTELAIDNKYIMSPKDLSTIHFLNKILDAGVDVLKIEGRARDGRYVQTTVSCYREAVEAWKDGEYEHEDIIEPKIRDWQKRLSTVFNRGFWDGYYLGQRLGEWTHSYGNQASLQKVYIGKCTNFFKHISVAEFKVETSDFIEENDHLLITGSTLGIYETTASDLHNAEQRIVKRVQKGEVFAIKTTQVIHRGDKLYKLIKKD